MTATRYTYAGHKRQQTIFRPHCSAPGRPGIAVERTGTGFWLDLESVEPFITDLRAAAIGARKNWETHTLKKNSCPDPATR